MALEDFFTLSEMKDGLVSLVRVEELVSIMESQKESIGSIAGDAARQWSTVGNIIAATDRKDCLDHFIQLNGLSYLKHWLEEAHRQKTEDGGDSSTEELVNATLTALDRLPIDWEASSACGIGLTVKQLHGNSWRSEKIQEKFKTLTAKWSFSEDGEIVNCKPTDGVGAACDDGLKSSSLLKTAVEEPEYLAVQEAKVNAVDDSMENEKSADLVVDKDRFPGEVSAQCSSPAVEVNTQCPQGTHDLPSAEHVLAVENPASASHCPSPKAREIRDDDEEKSDGSRREDDASNSQEEDMDIDVNSKEPNSDKTSSKNTFISPEILSGSRRPVDTSSVVGESKQERSEIGLEYGEIDALEVARQVAIEVEREVVDYREPFCSSSPEIAVCGDETMENADAELDDKNVDDDDDNDDVDGGDDDDDDNDEVDDDVDDEKGSSSKDSTSNSDDTLGVEESASDPAKSPLKSTAVHAEKKRCDFDLNEDFCSEEDNQPTAANLSAPVAMAAPKGSPTVPAAPLHFEGELGWRGSAATSAFRPAALTSQRQKSATISIDLNVADGSDDEALAAGDGLETGSRPDRLELDLNRREDDDLLPLTFWRPHQQNGFNPCASPASSSSSRQPSLRDFDLNDDPSAFEACGSSSSFLGRSTARSYKFEDPAVMIMGSRLGVDRRESNQRPMPYATMPPHGFGYNPAMSMLPPPFYGPGAVPYMVDSSGTTVVPQILSSAGIAPGVASRPPPFLMSMVGPPPGLNMGVGGSGMPGLDLNSGSSGSAHGDGGSFRHVQQGGGAGGGFVEDRVLKRKEPDWEPPYSFGCKQATSWQ